MKRLLVTFFILFVVSCSTKIETNEVELYSNNEERILSFHKVELSNADEETKELVIQAEEKNGVHQFVKYDKLLYIF
ncbi:hypothetical protein [Bacillus solimangrovi]|uniref:Lipoprotein n=1 Tax=Bacillus solimangrovi TaxID=1305675 RepID=A0A1E5LJW6_9BACI|nr:hypothetical protein [Bacillus solimangrovi]OEH94326.1 hypothetical protein BFG57_08710 [Bacillus solimangrovi]